MIHFDSDDNPEWVWLLIVFLHLGTISWIFELDFNIGTLLVIFLLSIVGSKILKKWSEE